MLVHPVHPFNVRQTNLQAIGGRYQRSSRFCITSALTLKERKNRDPFTRPLAFSAAAYDLSSYKEPVIVTGCDGVGTKTEILFELDMVETAGKDLVAMNVNDILTTGGDPLLFLDYLGISNLERERSRIIRLVAGMCDYLESCNCILAGGETGGNARCGAGIHRGTLRLLHRLL